MTRWGRSLAPAAAAAVLLLAGGVKLWATDSGAVLGGALVGAGLLLVGVAVREWIRDE